MRINEKAILRRSIIDLTSSDATRRESTDDAIRAARKKREFPEENLWDHVVALGAQLSRPPFDPYREKIKLKTEIGRKGTLKTILKIPILIYGEFNLSHSSQDALHLAMNNLADSNSTIGIISKDEPFEERKYPYFQIVDDINKIYDAEGVVLQYDSQIFEKINKIKNEFFGPIIVEIDQNFSEYLQKLLEFGVDGILTNTDKIINDSKYSGKHAIAVIHDVRSEINKFYQGKENDGAALIVAGDVDSSGKIVKSVGLGADLVGYDTTLLIAKVGYHSEDFFDELVTSEKIYNHMMATKNELTGIPAALGYSDFHNMSPSDFRTSSLKASMQGNIQLEGIDKTFKEIIAEILNNYLDEKKISIQPKQKQKIIEMVMEAN